MKSRPSGRVWTGLVLLVVWPVVGVFHAAAAEPLIVGPAAVQASVDQPKPAATFATHYLRNPDGSDPVVITLAYGPHAATTNANGEKVTPLSVPADTALLVGEGRVALPQGQTIVISRRNEQPGWGAPTLVSLTPLPHKPPQSLRKPGPFRFTLREPPTGVIFRPLVQLQGEANRRLQRILFGLQNGDRRSRVERGYVEKTLFDPAVWDFVGSQFQCFDVELLPGTNVLTLRLEADTGEVLLTNLVYVLRLELDDQPPTMRLDWPRAGQRVAGSHATLRGHLDDASAEIFVMREGGTEPPVQALIERDGRFWVERFPLRDGTNRLRLMARDAAGNESFLTVDLVRAEERLVMDPVPEEQLHQMHVRVTGLVEPPAQRVWVNGCEARVQPDGRWEAWPVPVTPGGVAVFDAVAVPVAGAAVAATAPQDVLRIQTRLPDQPVHLNLSRPACGVFELHLSGVAGRSFVLHSSTNLVNWTPVFTNHNAPEVFRFTVTNTAATGCQFFRVGPVE
ncbi:MAG: hypothetical protein ACK45B_11655 [Limisphaerales bacterium]